MERNHSKIRRQQRCIPRLIIEWLLEFGEVVRSHGADLYYFSKKSKKAIRRYAGRRPMQMMKQYMDAYLIYKDGCIVTIGHRYKKIRR